MGKTQTPNYNLTKDDQNEFYDILMHAQNMDLIDGALRDISKIIVASGTGTNILLSIPSITSYLANHKISFVAASNNEGVATTIKVNQLESKPLYKPNSTTAPKLVQGKAYEVWYNQVGDCFFLKASAEGNAIASNVLAGKTFSNDDDSGIIGTMTNRGAINSTLPINGTYTIPSGYHDGNGTVTQSIPTKSAQTYTPGTVNQTISSGQYLNGNQIILGDADLIPANIKSGKNIFGVVGDSSVVDTSAGTITSAAQILNGYKAYSDGMIYTGTMPTKSAQTYTPGTTNQTIASGRYLSGAQTILGDADLIASNIKNGKNIFGVTGSVVEKSEYSGINYDVAANINVPPLIDQINRVHTDGIQPIADVSIGRLRVSYSGDDVCFVTNIAIDLTSISTISSYAYSGSRGSWIHPMTIVASPVKSATRNTYTARAEIGTEDNGIYFLNLDVSSLTGNYYIRVHFGSANSSLGGGTANYLYINNLIFS